ncbi:MAG: T-protein [Chroococcidiopsis sp. SAG 2025]|uniref:bifunctional chorismate mutase/prephenate dehydrogenase n=1 Tax=Chroococcidiopsis sp. SAG 2025 TaxID=171389 RepID=UPI002936FE49|nr:bifunctional chorismate mutase/prephenate dehydrogenase [Chroococcidiopsis sp. SAG 2025]MDV2991448.1 T-protein [Chroococcidiopsis sp. SAG 2025]
MKYNSLDRDRSRKITIIGGRGRMGKFFTQHLSTAGHQVSTLGNQDWENASQLLGAAELVIVSVPIERTVTVIERAAKYLSPTTALVDITSIKTQPVQAMLVNHAGAVMGLHPMFGPSVKSFAGQKVVICSGRNDEIFQWLLDFIADRGGELISCTPEEHDRIMVTIQATQHFSRFCCGAFLSAENIDLDRSLSMSTPSYRQEIEIVNRLFAQNPALCVDIMLATEERCEAIARLAQTYSRLAELIVKKDRSSLIREFEIAQSFFNQENLAFTKQKEYAIAATQ